MWQIGHQTCAGKIPCSLTFLQMVWSSLPKRKETNVPYELWKLVWDKLERLHSEGCANTIYYFLIIKKTVSFAKESGWPRALSLFWRSYRHIATFQLHSLSPCPWNLQGGVSLKERQKQLYKSPRGGWFFLMGWGSTPEALLCLLFRVDKAEDGVKLCASRGRRWLFSHSFWKRGDTPFKRTERDWCFSFAGSEDWELEMVRPSGN